MAINKNASIRYRILDKCFRNPGRRYFIEDLIEECENMLLEIDPNSNGISLRQIRDDIAFMKGSEGWNVELGDYRDGRKMYYRYVDTSFSINNMPLNEMEMNQLQSAFEILSQFKGMPQFGWMNEILPKLKEGITTEEKPEIIIDFDSNEYLKGIENLGILYNAIFYKKVLKISYQTFESEAPYDLVLHPYYLKQYNNRWFLFGYNPENQKSDWNLALDRIKIIEEKKGKYKINKVIDWSDYFEDIIGVTKQEGSEPQKITLHYFGKTGKYIESKPIHGSQRSKWIDSDTLEVTLELIVNYEFERLILSYADSVKVISPKSITKKIKERLEKALEMF